MDARINLSEKSKQWWKKIAPMLINRLGEKKCPTCLEAHPCSQLKKSVFRKWTRFSHQFNGSQTTTEATLSVIHKHHRSHTSSGATRIQRLCSVCHDCSKTRTTTMLMRWCWQNSSTAWERKTMMIRATRVLTLAGLRPQICTMWSRRIQQSRLWKTNSTSRISGWLAHSTWAWQTANKISRRARLISRQLSASNPVI